eukprot:TRINITY_DN14609_c0_g1_i1.p1 TRINITY_DN14609_c0_g1~~TRINITY_DN14609_c0_g1_i1.p1  ORF type:complete len:236 (+),score=28.47 TRINITY_DN14609_c0_g1_i1:44-751(+)
MHPLSVRSLVCPWAALIVTSPWTPIELNGWLNSSRMRELRVWYVGAMEPTHVTVLTEDGVEVRAEVNEGDTVASIKEKVAQQGHHVYARGGIYNCTTELDEASSVSGISQYHRLQIAPPTGELPVARQCFTSDMYLTFRNLDSGRTEEYMEVQSTDRVRALKLLWVSRNGGAYSAVRLYFDPKQRASRNPTKMLDDDELTLAEAKVYDPEAGSVRDTYNTIVGVRLDLGPTSETK